MAYLAVNLDSSEVMLLGDNLPQRMPEGWWAPNDEDAIVNYDIYYLDDGFIEKYLGRKLTWDDEPVRLTN